MDSFLERFDAEFAPRLALRANSFRAMFRHLETLDLPEILIVETGCARQAGNWAGDGQSTVLFDQYVGFLKAAGRQGRVISVDLSADAVAACRALVSGNVEVNEGDSVAFLSRLASAPTLPPALVYLDSYDLDSAWPLPSAIHHLKELCAIRPLLEPWTLVAVDDAPSQVDCVLDGDKATFVRSPRIGGKGLLVAEYADAVGAQLVFSGYQAGWTNLGSG